MAAAVAERLVLMITEVAPVNERIIRLRITRTLGVISLVSVYAPTGVSALSVKEMLRSAPECGCLLSQGDTLIVLVDSNATSGTDKDGCESCFGPHGSRLKEESSSLLIVFAKIRRLRIVESWFHRPELHRLTWYSNSGAVRKEIDNVLVGGRWRLVQNCSIIRSAEFAGTDHRLLAATLKIRLESRKLAQSHQVRLDVRRLRGQSIAKEYKRELVESLGKHNSFNSTIPSSLD